MGSIRPQHITIRIGHIENEYALYITDAPQAFDYEDTLECIKDGLTRYVLIPADNVQEQIARYPLSYNSQRHVNEHIIKYACEKLFLKILERRY